MRRVQTLGVVTNVPWMDRQNAVDDVDKTQVLGYGYRRERQMLRYWVESIVAYLPGLVLLCTTV
jgi:hypothetical protein